MEGAIESRDTTTHTDSPMDTGPGRDQKRRKKRTSRSSSSASSQKDKYKDRYKDRVGASYIHISQFDVLKLLGGGYAVVSHWPTGTVSCIRLSKRRYNIYTMFADEHGHITKHLNNYTRRQIKDKSSEVNTAEYLMSF